jgi:hypothetical protein
MRDHQEAAGRDGRRQPVHDLREKTLRCAGRGKDRRGCGVTGIDLASVMTQIEAIAGNPATDVYWYQRVSGNQGELDELTAELDRVRRTLAATDDDEFDRLSARRKQLRGAIEAFDLVPETYEMTPTGETLADLWQTGDKRAIMKALQRYISFNVGTPRGPQDPFIWIEGAYPSETLIELTEDTCIKMTIQPTEADHPVAPTP